MDADTTWKWYRSSSANGPWREENEIANATVATYTVSDETDDDDRNNFLRAVANYTDPRGGNKEADFVSTNKVKGIITNANSAPVLTSSAVASRRIDERLANANVGGPVTGTDADGDVLTYQLTGEDAPDASPRFSIDPATGQIKTTGALDFEAPTDQGAYSPDPMRLVQPETIRTKW